MIYTAIKIALYKIFCSWLKPKPSECHHRPTHPPPHPPPHGCVMTGCRAQFCGMRPGFSALG